MSSHLWAFCFLLLGIPVALTSVRAQQCSAANEDYDCKVSFSTVIGGNKRPLEFDFMPLCSEGSDYNFTDGKGHNYTANVCGYTHTPCDPATCDETPDHLFSGPPCKPWNNTVASGVAIQYW